MGYGIKRGDIFYISRTPVIGHEQFSGRPAIVVSCNADNKHCETVEIVYLTTQPKADLPTHVMIRSAKFQSTALCEQVTTVSTSRLGDYYGSCTREEMEEVNAAIMVSLGLCFGLVEQEEPCEEETPGTFDGVRQERKRSHRKIGGRARYLPNHVRVATV